jgi:FAD:protein FMN transferase
VTEQQQAVGGPGPSGLRSPHDAADLPRLPAPDSPPDPVAHPKRAWVEQIMGMPVSIHLRGPGLDARPGDPALNPRLEPAVAAAFAGLREVDALFSTWIPDSQVSRLQRGELALADCDPRVREVAALCEQARDRTGGWFDADLPGPDGVRRWDPTGLVKGWAVQRCCDGLATALATSPAAAPAAAPAGPRPGIEDGVDVLVNAGGDLAARCLRADSGPFSVAIEDPRDRHRMVAMVPLRDGGVATSGTAARGAHILSPPSGLATAELASVSVIGPSLLWADVYATAAFAQGRTAVDWLRTLTGHTWVVVDLDGAVAAG